MKADPEPEPAQEILYGVHPVLEALRSGRRDVERVYVAREGGGAGLGRLLRTAREAGVPVTHLPRTVLGRKLGRAAHQGVAALVAAVPYADPAEVVERARAAGEQGLLLALDRITDPRNLGAILRTAAAAGAQGALLGGEETVGLTPVVAKAAAGAVDRVPVAREPKLARRLEHLRTAGFETVALDPRGSLDWDAVDLRGPLVVVAGGEAAGPRTSLLRACARRVRVPLHPGVDSLNVSVAVGVVLFEAVRQRRAGAPGGAPPPRGREA